MAAIGLSLCAAALAAAQTPQVRVDQGALLLKLPSPPAGVGELAVWIDQTDVSAWLQRPQLDQWRLPAAVMSWLGEPRRVQVYWVSDGRWQPLVEHDLVPAAASRGPVALKPRIDLSIKAQPSAEAHGSQKLEPRRTFDDLTLRAALALDQSLGDFTLRGAANLAGSSYRQEALRWSALGVDAPKFDLADYRFDITGKPFTLGVGHLGFGSHPLLLEGYSTRGINARLTVGAGWDVQLAAGNGSAIVGYSNPLGLADSQHQLHLATLGVDWDPAQPGRWRAELSYLDGSQRAIANFNRGEIPDAERIRGVGLRGRGSWLDNRLRVDLAMARLRHEAAEDPQLRIGNQGLRAIAPATRNAASIDIGYELLRAWTGWSERLPLALSLQAQVRVIAPLYKTIGTFLAADQQTDRIVATASFGAAQVQLFADRREDNLDNLPNLLKTGTRNAGVAITLPASLWTLEAPPAWLPSATLRLARHAQHALNAPDFAQSGLAPTHRPDQATRGAQLGLAWTIDRLSFAYQWQSNFQDNRQTGREGADFLASGHQAQLQWSAGDALQLALNIGRSRNHAYERSRSEYSDSAGLSATWRIDERNTLNAQFNAQRGSDSLHQTSSRQENLQAQWARRFDWRWSDGTPLPAQGFLRYAQLRAAQSDAVFGNSSRGRHWTLNAGIGITLGAP